LEEQPVPRIQDLDLYRSQLTRGALNSITDVKGVAVGHHTHYEGEGEWRPGQGPFRTGITLIVPHQDNLYEEKVPAAVHTINGFGKVAGFEQVREVGNVETPIALTGTLNVPRVADALMSLAIEQNPHIGVGFAETGRRGYVSVNPLVGETSDAFLSDAQARPIGEKEVRLALSGATRGVVAEGVVGAGTGTSCFGWKGGIGSASRSLPARQGGFVVGCLVQSNFGRPEQLTVAGVPIGRFLKPEPADLRYDDGSIMIVLSTDAPLDTRHLGRLCQRAAFGLARTGSSCQHGSGDFVIAFSTAYRISDRPGQLTVSRTLLLQEETVMNGLFLAVIESVEEAIYNSMLMAHTVVGRDGNTRLGLPADEVVRLVHKHGRSAAD
jgi:D-aminopeptidase